MSAGPESPESRKTYRAARRAFIAACEKAHIDTVARLHPSKGADGKPLFMDCAALGPRRATRAVLVVGYDAADTELLVQLLNDITPPKDARLVLVHAFDPAAFAGVAGIPSWPRAMLGAVATEDLSRVRALGVLALGREDLSLEPALQASLPGAVMTILPPAKSAMEAQAAVTAFLAD
ncbi:MAG TPA: DUF2817 domain-containing protein [Rhizomicrobium sp.]|nr:DUF2817 domain-containing protein [Rhizomicrobium sp.]